MGAHHRRAYVCNLGYVNTKVDCDVRRHTRDETQDTRATHRDNTGPIQAKAKARQLLDESAYD